MKTLNKDDLYNNLSQFLETRGVKLKKGSYTRALQSGCSFLTDAVNLGQESFEYARTELDHKLDQVRQVVHEATASKGTKKPRPASTKPSPAAEKPSKKAAQQETQALKQQAATRRKREAVKASPKNPKVK